MDVGYGNKAKALLKRFYGYGSFRPGQLEIITAVAAGRDALVLMPTGGGKSLCYQIPALMSDGCAIVVSPLIALMQDQVASLVSNGIPAATVNSNISDADNRRVMDLFFEGKLKLLYISPERLMSDIDRWSPELKVSLIAIDEAHCISQWGHDFRPVYTSLSQLKGHFPSSPVVALTATADRLTRSDIARHLKLDDPFTWIGSFDRPNLSLRVIPESRKAKRLAYICGMIEKYPLDSGIVYCLSRKATESLDAELRGKGYRSCCYHAGMAASARDMAQRAFINGDVQVVCATVAFGMGIDKSNIRWVVHANLPANIESYYQEIGRAGRDGLPAETALFYSFADIAARQSLIQESGQPMLNMEKLSRMKEYAEASVCRRRILLSYFGETGSHDCGNCDVCQSPPERFDGTVLVQKALSAMVRTGEKVGAMMLVDILRGSARAEIFARGYDKIKTYGVGRDVPYAMWNAYLAQMLQLGLIEIAYEDGNRLRVTVEGHKALRGEIKVMLSKVDIGSRSPRKAKSGVTEKPKEDLVSYLKKVRKTIADREGIPAYIVFSDATLRDMAAKMPRDMASMKDVTGVGELKSARYGAVFLKAISDYMLARL